MDSTKVVMDTMLEQFLLYGVWILPLTVFSGIASYYQDVKVSHRVGSFVELCIEATIVAPLAGLMGLLLSIYAELDIAITAVIVMGSAYRGAVVFEIIWTLAINKVARVIGVDPKVLIMRKNPPGSDNADSN